jgi:hypothetical protein
MIIVNPLKKEKLVDCRGKWLYFLHYVSTIPLLAVCLSFTKWIFGFVSDIDVFEVEKRKRRLHWWQKDCVKHKPD